jgi:DNA mismatch repair ATPase MutS
MRVLLTHPERDFEVESHWRDEIFGALMSGKPHALANIKRNIRRAQSPEPVESPSAADTWLIEDLELETLWTAMAAGDDFLFETAKRAMMSSLQEPDAITYRQRVMADCIAHGDVVDQLYRLAIEALHSESATGLALLQTEMPETLLHRSVRMLSMHAGVLRRLRQLADEHAAKFRSDGFRRFFAMIRSELSDEYLDELQRRLDELEFKRGVLESAGLGKGNKGRGYTIHLAPGQTWKERLRLGKRTDSYSFEIPARDEAGFRALSEIRGRGINVAADVVAQSAEHVNAFFAMLRLELAFYLGCLNLRQALENEGEPTCFPLPVPDDDRRFAADGLYDPALTLQTRAGVVGNDVEADGRSLVVITGANQGGKSTLLRSVGLAQLMMQSGMFVAARSLTASVCTGTFTHYKREEDAAMERGKLDEELSRMRAIADAIKPGALLLCNESFASTNEREGSAIAREVVDAMLDKGIRVLFVTHMYELAHGFQAQARDSALFLRADRTADGGRTFRVSEGAPLPTSYGADSYRRIFGDAQGADATAIEA